MHWLFSIFADRLRALFVADVALELETQALSREAERKAEILRQAEGYRRQGLGPLADELQQRAEQLSWNEPLAGVLPAVEHWSRQAVSDAATAPLDAPVQDDGDPPRLSSARKKSAKKKR